LIGASAGRAAQSASPGMIAVGGSHTCRIEPNSTVTCWGDNRFDQLGNEGMERSASPVVVAGIEGAVGLAAGAGHTCAIVTDGAVVCWGKNDLAQLGAATPRRPAPTGRAWSGGGVDCRARSHVRAAGGRFGMVLGRKQR
jgi:hypothetical protein